uniref:Uncharacterized protein n=1 Tax=Musa balbisiana TaxID=52838 RepID=L8BTE4_MUSBA|nr:Hypothetical protein BN340_100 [Musa balbisiana]
MASGILSPRRTSITFVASYAHTAALILPPFSLRKTQWGMNPALPVSFVTDAGMEVSSSEREREDSLGVKPRYGVCHVLLLYDRPTLDWLMEGESSMSVQEYAVKGSKGRLGEEDKFYS